MTYATIHYRLSDGQILSYDIAQLVVLIGRDLANDLVVTDLTVSPKHAQLLYQNGQFTLEDFGSVGGTWLNGQRLTPNTPYTLMGSEVIRFGNVEAVIGAAHSGPPQWPLEITPDLPDLATQRVAATAQVTGAAAPATTTTAGASRPIIVRLSPKKSTGDFTVAVNYMQRSPTDVARSVILAGTDEADQLTFTFKPQVMTLAPGERKTARLSVRGRPSQFTVTATTEGYTASSRGELVRPNRTTLWVVLTMLLLVLGSSGVFALAACPTVFKNFCGFVPNNPIAMAVSTATFTPSPTLTNTPTATPMPPTLTYTPAPTLAPSNTPVPSPTFTISPTAPVKAGLLTFKSQQANGTYSLIAVSPDGGATALLANQLDLRVVDYAPATGLFAVDVFNGAVHNLVLVRNDGAIVRDPFNDGWDAIRDGDFSPDGSLLVIEGEIAGQTRFFFYDKTGKLGQLARLITPTNTATFTLTPTITRTPTITLTPSKTFTPSNTPTSTNTPRPTNTPTSTFTPTATRTPTNTITPSPTTTPTP
jgi:pSer/pThr/pTyr-binding forkhead associated (FHA) protein